MDIYYGSIHFDNFNNLYWHNHYNIYKMNVFKQDVQCVIHLEKKEKLKIKNFLVFPNTREIYVIVNNMNNSFPQEPLFCQLMKLVDGKLKLLRTNKELGKFNQCSGPTDIKLFYGSNKYIYCELFFFSFSSQLFQLISVDLDTLEVTLIHKKYYSEGIGYVVNNNKIWLVTKEKLIAQTTDTPDYDLRYNDFIGTQYIPTKKGLVFIHKQEVIVKGIEKTTIISTMRDRQPNITINPSNGDLFIRSGGKIYRFDCGLTGSCDFRWLAAKIVRIVRILYRNDEIQNEVIKQIVFSIGGDAFTPLMLYNLIDFGKDKSTLGSNLNEFYEEKILCNK